ncbi:MAG: hypothetical protein R3C53_06945 [Pirellulaceae bacterium]
MSQRLLKNAPRRVVEAVAVAVVLLIAVYMRWVWGELWIVNWIPLPSVIVLANWFPIFLAVLGAAFWKRMEDSSWPRKLPIQAALLTAAAWSVLYVIPRSPPECRDEWIPAEPPVPFRICRQTTPYTCSAAASATILEMLGMETTEAEMATLCLTSSGTTWLGMYHGLSIKLMPSGHGVKFFQGTVDDVSQLAGTRPILLCCQLTEATAAAQPSYVEEGGWIPGVQHSVVCFAVSNGNFWIGDPSQDHLERWSRRDMEVLWTGTGLMVIDYAAQ